MLHVENLIERNCRLVFDFCLNWKMENLHGLIEYEDSIFWFLIDNEKEKIRLFDFNEDIGVQYDVRIRQNSFKMLVKNEIEAEMVTKVFVLKESFCYEESLYDIVFLVNTKELVIGTYISQIIDGKEQITVKRGDLLEKYIDYSDTESVLLR